MAARKRSEPASARAGSTARRRAAAREVPEEQRRQCALRPQPVPVLSPDLEPDRQRAILRGRTKWANGTVLHYYFFDEDSDGENVTFSDGSTRFVTWVGPEDQREAVRQAFQKWKALGIGLDFREVGDRSEAEVRIGFMDTDGSWSAVGRDVLQAGADKRTMNFGWDLTTPYGGSTALHEIGHTLGMPHEHQNPFAGIQWDEQKVYAYFRGSPNFWNDQETFHNVLRKLTQSEVEGSTWDPDSIMEYWFPAGLIREPAAYRNGLDPPGTLSAIDKQFVLGWYPPLGPAPPPTLSPFQSVPLALKPRGQADFTLAPPGSRTYEISTFGAADTVMVLFEEVDGRLRYVKGDDDSGVDRNAKFSAKLFQGRRYVLRVRLYYAWASGQTAVMYW